MPKKNKKFNTAVLAKHFTMTATFFLKKNAKVKIIDDKLHVGYMIPPEKKNQPIIICISYTHPVFQQDAEGNTIPDDRKEFLMYGCLTHEILHPVYTPFDIYNEMCAKVKEKELCHDIANVLEDFAIETHSGLIFGGTMLAALDAFIEHVYSLEPAIDAGIRGVVDPQYYPLYDVQSLISAMILVGDRGELKGEFLTKEAEDVWEKVKPLFMDGAHISRGSVRAEYVKKIYDLILPLVKNVYVQQTSNPNGSGNGINLPQYNNYQFQQDPQDNGNNSSQSSQQSQSGSQQSSQSQSNSSSNEQSGSEENDSNSSQEESNNTNAGNSSNNNSNNKTEKESENSKSKKEKSKSEKSNAGKTASEKSDESNGKGSDSDSNDSEENNGSSGSKNSKSDDSESDEPEESGKKSSKGNGSDDESDNSENGNEGSENETDREGSSEKNGSDKSDDDTENESDGEGSSEYDDSDESDRSSGEDGSEETDDTSGEDGSDNENGSNSENGKSEKNSDKSEINNGKESGEENESESDNNSIYDPEDFQAGKASGNDPDTENETIDLSESEQSAEEDEAKRKAAEELFKRFIEELDETYDKVEAEEEAERLAEIAKSKDLPQNSRLAKHVRVKGGDSCLYESLAEANYSRTQILKRNLKNVFRGDNGGKKISEHGSRISPKRLTDGKLHTRVMVNYRNPENIRDMAILLAVDLSGSMVNKIDETRDALITMYEALEYFKVPLSVMGFTSSVLDGDSSSVHYHYVTWNHSSKDKESLANICAMRNNYDYVAINEGTQMLKKVTAKHKLMIVLSDGAPCTMYGMSCDTANAFTKKAIDDARKENISVVGVGICAWDPMEYASMYGKDFVTTKTAEELPTKLSDILKNVVKNWIEN